MFSLLFTAFLFAKLVNGSTLIVLFDISNTTSPAVNSILSLIVSMFSSGYFSSVILFIVCILRIYHISPSGILFVVIVIAPPTICHVPMSSGVSITLCPVGVPFATLSCTSFCFIVFGVMVIIPVLLTLPYRDWETDRKSVV